MHLVAPNDPILNKVCRPDFTIRRGVIEGMYRLMRKLDGLGLAAPQVGIDGRFFITHWNEVFIDPHIVEIARPTRGFERCLSLPNFISVEINRWGMIRLADGRVYEDEQAAVILHEIDHLNGILITDKRI